MNMRLTFLGTGGSLGVPVPGIGWGECRKRRKNRRTRSSIHVAENSVSLIVDTPTDFNSRVIREGINVVDCVLYTHRHPDHVMGFTDLRGYARKKDAPVSVYGNQKVLDVITNYYGGEDNCGKMFALHVAGDRVVNIDGKLPVEAISLKHGHEESEAVTGYIIDNKVAYFTDCVALPDEVIDKVKGIPILILGCNTIQKDEPKKHMDMDDAVKYSEKVNPEELFLTHLSYKVDYYELSKKLKSEKKITVTYDGLEVNI
jgi:phosphoribosyl 1,2-cyclic phosphate phosphodiesterase